VQPATSEMQEPLPVRSDGIRNGLRSLLRHKGMIAAAVLAGLTISFLMRLQLISRYEAEAQIVLDVRSTRILKFDAVLSGLPPAPEVLHTEMDVISSRAMADRVFSHLSSVDLRRLAATSEVVTPLAQALGDARRAFANRLREWLPGLSVVDPVASMRYRPVGAQSDNPGREEFIELILSGLKVSNDGRSYTIRIGYDSPDPQLAAILANLYAEQYLASQLDRKLEATQNATAWLSSRLVELRRQLEASEATVESYRHTAGILKDKGTTLTAQELSAVNTDLVAVRNQRLDAESRLIAVRALLRSGGDLQGLTELVSSQIVQTLRQKQLELKRRKDEIGGQYTTKYPGIKRLETELRGLQRQIDAETNAVLGNLANQVNVARMKEEGLQQSRVKLEERFGIGSDAEVKLQQLQREADADRSVYEAYLSRYKETSEQEKLQEPDAYEISTAAVPTVPRYPRTRPLLALGTIFGGLIGVAGAFLYELLDQRLRSVGQVEGATGLRVLGLLPSLRGRAWARPEEHVLRRPRSMFNEALRTTWTALSLSDGRPTGKVVVITSSVPDEGKTAFGLALARSLAIDGRRILLIDGDLRRPGVARAFGATEEGRLGDLLAGRAELQDAIQTDRLSGAHYIAAEGSNSHPQDLLASRNWAPILSQARALYDVVLVDTPPILVAPDAALVAQCADRCLFFIRWGSTSREHVASALNRLALYKIRISGVVMSHVNMRRHARYAGGEGYYRSYGLRRKLLQIARS
jgi:succinoglycan biosynthesis transport protein ExoP